MTIAEFDIGSVHFQVTTLKLWTLAVLVASVSLHESAHAYVAVACGDDTPIRQGRRTLNPLRHLDPFMSVILPALLLFSQYPYVFGAGRPVKVSPENMRVPDRDFALVAIAGPAMNALLVVLFTAIHVVGKHQGWSSSADPASGDPAAMVGYVMREAIALNIILMVFNLIPIPPLDGSRIVAYLLPNVFKRLWYSLDAIGFVVLVVLLLTGMLNRVFLSIYVPIRNWWVTFYGAWL